jgi:acetyl-CoA carboxylase carboxyltransferase component
MMYPNVMGSHLSVVIDRACGGAYCAMDSRANSVRSCLYRCYDFTAGQIAVMGKESSSFLSIDQSQGMARGRIASACYSLM